MPGWRRRQHALMTRPYGPNAGTTWLSWIGTERIAIGSVPAAATIGRLAAEGVTHVAPRRPT